MVMQLRPRTRKVCYSESLTLENTRGTRKKRRLLETEPDHQHTHVRKRTKVAATPNEQHVEPCTMKLEEEDSGDRDVSIVESDHDSSVWDDDDRLVFLVGYMCLDVAIMVASWFMRRNRHLDHSELMAAVERVQKFKKDYPLSAIIEGSDPSAWDGIIPGARIEDVLLPDGLVTSYIEELGSSTTHSGSSSSKRVPVLSGVEHPNHNYLEKVTKWLETTVPGLRPPIVEGLTCEPRDD